MPFRDVSFMIKFKLSEMEDINKMEIAVVLQGVHYSKASLCHHKNAIGDLNNGLYKIYFKNKVELGDKSYKSINFCPVRSCCGDWVLVHLKNLYNIYFSIEQI